MLVPEKWNIGILEYWINDLNASIHYSVGPLFRSSNQREENSCQQH
jgi:hypothetical protein